MNHKLKSSQATSSSPCEAKIDRVRIAAHPKTSITPPTLPESFRTVRDCFVRRQTSIKTYRRCRELLSEKTGARLFWQYAAVPAWLAPWRITFVADDHRGLTLDEISAILALCRDYSLLVVELAFDFSQRSGVDRDFILRHAVFGKSHRRLDRGGSGQLRYGSRTSDTMVRAYLKPEIRRFRTELELHSRFLRSHRLGRLPQLTKLKCVLLPSHFRFVALDWGGLERYFKRRPGNRSGQVLKAARAKSKSIQDLCRYLRQQGVVNTHRFWTPLPQNALTQDALNTWATAFEEGRHED